LGKTIICFNYFSLFDKGGRGRGRGGGGGGGRGGGGGGRVDSLVGGQKRDREDGGGGDGGVGMKGNKNDYLLLLFINGSLFIFHYLIILFFFGI
jgi:hypothetical protein